MFKKILGTAGSKMIIALISLVIVFLNARVLGPEGLGIIALIVLAVTIILMINNVVGGSILVYLVPRYDNYKLLIISYIWTAIILVAFGFILRIVPLVPARFNTHVLVLALASCLYNLHLFMLLGREKIRVYNLITTLQSLVQLVSLFTFFIVFTYRTVDAFIYALLISYLFSLLASSLVLLPQVRISRLGDTRELIRMIFKLGVYNQAATFFQTMNYRLNYYLIDHYTGKAGLGMFHLPNQLAEGTWVIGRSVAIVQYSKISNTTDMDYARRLTIRLMKLVFVASVLVIGLFLLIPDRVFLYFGEAFTSTKLIILCVAAGIITNSVAMSFGHYFVGIGRMFVNTFASCVGLVFTLLFGFWLIPRYGILGAGITASVSYTVNMLVLMITFIRVAKPRMADFLISRQDYFFIREEIRKIRGKQFTGSVPPDVND